MKHLIEKYKEYIKSNEKELKGLDQAELCFDNLKRQITLEAYNKALRMVIKHLQEAEKPEMKIRAGAFPRLATAQFITNRLFDDTEVYLFDVENNKHKIKAVGAEGVYLENGVVPLEDNVTLKIGYYENK